jgi:hypothetical protein
MADSVDTTAVDPQPEAAPKEGTLPSQFGKINNLAKDDELVKQAQAFAFKHISRFEAQDARKKLTDTKGTMDKADRAWRAAQDVTGKKDTASSQDQDTLSQTFSPIFHETIRTLTAGETAIYFQEDDVPAKYRPTIDTTEYSLQEGKMLAEQQNMLEEYTFAHDNRKEKIVDGCLLKNKYGQQVWTMEWHRQVEKKTERVAIRDEEDGEIIGYKMATRERVIADWPTLVRKPLRNFYADASIEDLQMQRVVGEEGKIGYEGLAAQQRAGFIVNLEKVTNASLFKEELEDTLERRAQNAGETLEDEETGLYKIWQVWARMPIKEMKRKGRGKWDNREAPEWYWMTFVGELGGHAVCVRFIKNPYNHGKLPYFMEHAYFDDKGLYHIAPIDIIESLKDQIDINTNQAIDNVTLRTLSPYTLKGHSYTRDMRFRANKVIKLGQGAELKPIDVPRTTEITMDLRRELKNDFKEALAVTDPIQGEAFGQRTSALEANTAFEQAMKPLMQKADDNANKLFKWMLEMDAELWRQYGDPDTVLSVTHNNQIEEIKPAELFGPYKVEVTAPTEFANNLSSRREINAFLQNGYQPFAAVAGKQGEREFWRFALPKFFGAIGVNRMVPPNGDYDATRIAVDETGRMLAMSADIGTLGVFVPVEQEENHTAHLAVHEPALREYRLLPQDEQLSENAQFLAAHIEAHKNMRTQQESQGQVPGAAGAEGTDAQLAMDSFEGEMGAQAGG